MLLAIYVRTKITSKRQEQLNFISENLVVVLGFFLAAVCKKVGNDGSFLKCLWSHSHLDKKKKVFPLGWGFLFFILNLIDEGAKLNAYKLNTYHCSCTRRCKNWVEGQSHGNAHLLWREKVDAWVCTCINLPLFVIMQLIAKQIVRWRVSLELMQLQLLCHCG